MVIYSRLRYFFSFIENNLLACYRPDTFRRANSRSRQGPQQICFGLPGKETQSGNFSNWQRFNHQI